MSGEGEVGSAIMRGDEEEERKEDGSGVFFCGKKIGRPC